MQQLPRLCENVSTVADGVIALLHADRASKTSLHVAIGGMMHGLTAKLQITAVHGTCGNQCESRIELPFVYALVI